MSWYAIRTVYLWGQNSVGKNVFEERIVAFEASSVKEAFEKSAKESKEYSNERDDVKYEMHSDRIAYELDNEKLIDGFEVWSEMYESNESLSEFYNNRYLKYEYHPE